MSGTASNRNRPGRRTAVELGQLTREMLADAVQKWVYLETIAEKLHLAQNTVRKYAREWGVKFARGRPKGHHRHYGGLIRWVREHKDVALPCSAKKIQELTGCSEDSIKSYLRRQRAAIKKYLRDLPDLKQSGLRFKSSTGVVIPFAGVRSYTLSFHPWHLTVLLTCHAVGRVFKKKFTFAQFKKFTRGFISPPVASLP